MRNIGSKDAGRWVQLTAQETLHNFFPWPVDLPEKPDEFRRDCEYPVFHFEFLLAFYRRPCSLSTAVRFTVDVDRLIDQHYRTRFPCGQPSRRHIEGGDDLIDFDEVQSAIRIFGLRLLTRAGGLRSVAVTMLLPPRARGNDGPMTTRQASSKVAFLVGTQMMQMMRFKKR